MAIELYKKGIEELEKGIAVDINGQGKSPKQDSQTGELVWRRLE